ncbi:MAG TPA: hypothetical protein VMG10_14405 [Gemmataceae bacterium]|nr:hypothetical protein [Gemmataceae bacterium]
MTLEDALRELLAHYRAAARQAEAAGDDGEAALCTRRRDWLAGWIGFRTKLENRRMNTVRAGYAGSRYPSF